MLNITSVKALGMSILVSVLSDRQRSSQINVFGGGPIVIGWPTNLNLSERFLRSRMKLNQKCFFYKIARFNR